jgi:hypothetical protein
VGEEIEGKKEPQNSRGISRPARGRRFLKKGYE